MEIARIYIKKEFHGRQGGRLLFHTAVAAAIKQKQHYIWLGVWENNPGAIAFYNKMGFRPVGHHIFTLGHDLQKDIIMRMDMGS
jgi:ribosomal protein S18 acetylase RimI-like enzyme